MSYDTLNIQNFAYAKDVAILRARVSTLEAMVEKLTAAERSTEQGTGNKLKSAMALLSEWQAKCGDDSYPDIRDLNKRTDALHSATADI